MKMLIKIIFCFLVISTKVLNNKTPSKLIFLSKNHSAMPYGYIKQVTLVVNKAENYHFNQKD